SGSGIKAVTADVSALTSAQTALPLSSGSFTCGGVGGFNYQSTVQTANASLAEGSKSFSVVATDNLGTAATTSGWSVTVDNTAPGTVSARIIDVSVTPSVIDYVKQGHLYQVCASVSDAGSGIKTVTADLSALSTGQAAVSLGSGTFTCG